MASMTAVRSGAGDGSVIMCEMQWQSFLAFETLPDLVTAHGFLEQSVPFRCS